MGEYTQQQGYLEPTDKSSVAMFKRQLKGEVVMLNLLRFQDVADYRNFPALKPQEPISGAAAYKKYMAHAGPILNRHGGELVFVGDGGHFYIGPSDELWDLAMLVKYPSQQVFIDFTSDPEYLAGIGHRSAALADSRLLPLSPKMP
ncbi:DUF1330 domain-containing protein [Microbulbifer sp. ALW1]|uniref:DUF1330 domain-containing protein n=1 Tax=Microbulbifer sp. (strain ALW1) TaxID=1516059 RepID=UPI00135B4151|nr:DUF1330 domain-containing protein [Microbulbifer sp. ALW1]